MALSDLLTKAAGSPRREQHTLPDGTVVYVGEIGTDEWLEIESETMEWCARNGKETDPLIDARLIVRSVTDENNQLLSPRYSPTGDHEKDRAALATYEAELQKIAKTVRRVGQPLLRLVNRVNFASDAELESLKKKSDSMILAGSSPSVMERDS